MYKLYWNKDTAAVAPEMVLEEAGLAYEKMGDFACAYQDFDRAVEINPDLTVAYRSRACITNKSVNDCMEIEDLEMADHLAAMRVAQLSGGSFYRNSAV